MYLSQKEHILPPGLRASFFEFITMLEANNCEPLLVIGRTGTGKSYFLRAAEHYFANDAVIKCRVTIINCSHFSGDLNMVRSELFGHVKGAFTGATNNKKGIIEESSGGVLILEEVGDLPEEAQAQLLTFIEDGKYYRVGSNNFEKADVRIIAATNRPEALREDFRFRFCEICIPPLHKRRLDVLFYFEQFDSSIFSRLNGWEILALLAYNWPGNVREIERIIAKIRGKERLREKYEVFYESTIDKNSCAALLWGGIILEVTESKIAKEALSFASCLSYLELFASDEEVDAFRLLDNILSKHMLGIFGLSNYQPFANAALIDKSSTVKIADFLMCKSTLFDLINEGFEIFCCVFGKDPLSEDSLLSVSFNDQYLNNFRVPKIFLKNSIHSKASSFLIENRYKKIFKFAFKLVTGIDAEFDIYEYGLDKEFKDWFVSRAPNREGNCFAATDVDINQKIFRDNLARLTREDLLKAYYSELLSKHRYNQTAAALNAGVNLSTFRSQAMRHGVALTKP